MRVPTAERQVQLQPTSPVKFVAADSGGGVMGAVAKGLEEIGGGVANYADTLHRVKQDQAQLEARDADNAFANSISDALYSANGLTNLRESAAVNAFEPTMSGIKATRDSIAAGLSPMARKMFDDSAEGREQSAYTIAARHVGVEHGAALKATDLAAIATNTSDAGNAWANLDQSNKSIGQIVSTVNSMADREGWGDEQRHNATLDAVSKARSEVGLRLSDADPSIARQYLEQYKDQFTSDDARRVGEAARIAQARLDAEARRQEAEARAQERLDRADAAARAEDTLRIIQTGTPVPQAQMESAIHDANRAAKPGLAFSLAQGAFKNNLNVVYRSSTPAEIQDRLNELGPAIAAAGDHPQSQDMVEFNHLTDLKRQSATELARDPISWGAAHLGLPTGQLNWNDPATIRQRAHNAQVIAARTGVQPKVLTDEEASTIAPAATDGTVQQQWEAISKLASFGPQWSGVAAQQVAPNNHRFATLVGLASIPERSVANAIVSKALQAPAVTAAHPGIINDAAFQAKFNRAVGQAFQLLPNAAEGVRQVATSLLAVNSAQAGVFAGAESSSAVAGSGQDPVLASINGALGAYADHGVIRGGLGNDLTGAITVLPHGVTQDQFLKTIARATAPQLLGASNGHPVWKNGQPLWTGDVKSMRFVPVGDGRYRLDSGTGFVQRKEGGFYELDFSKLR